MNKYICLSFDFILIIFLLNDVFHILFSLQRPKIDRCNKKIRPFSLALRVKGVRG